MLPKPIIFVISSVCAIALGILLVIAGIVTALVYTNVWFFVGISCFGAIVLGYGIAIQWVLNDRSLASTLLGK